MRNLITCCKWGVLAKTGFSKECTDGPRRRISSLAKVQSSKQSLLCAAELGRQQTYLQGLRTSQGGSVLAGEL